VSNPKIKTTTGKHKCGFCTWGQRHDLCPSGTLNGSGLEVIQCPCGCERSQQYKCLDCGTRDQGEIDQSTWRCIDKDGCNARIEHRLATNPVIVQIREVRAAAAQGKEQLRAQERARRIEAGEDVPAVRVKRDPRPASGQCLHCGEPTKGGKFLPGHDAAYLSILAAEIAGGRSFDEVIEAMTAGGCSEALIGKLRKRVVVAA